jgi:predicted GIY-YIG superfamily endonuclease
MDPIFYNLGDNPITPENEDEFVKSHQYYSRGDLSEREFGTALFKNPNSKWYVYIMVLRPAGLTSKLMKNNALYYVGVTTDTERRLKKHIEKPTCEWTRENMPLKIVSVQYIGDDQKLAKKVEHIQTIVMMKKYGVGSVRGASYIWKELTAEQLAEIDTFLQVLR